MSLTKRLVMRFLDSNGRRVTFSVNPPKEPVNLARVEELMDLIIATDTFYTFTGGSLVAKVDVRLFTEVVEELEEF